MGFTSYDIVENTAPTVEEIVAGLTGAQKVSILNGFTFDKPAITLKHELLISERAIQSLYNEIDAIEESCRSLMRGEVLVTEAILDTDPLSETFGEVLTPAVYNTAPTDIDTLKTEILAIHQNGFNGGEVEAIIDRMIAYSKSDGTGTPAFYASEVIK